MAGRLHDEQAGHGTLALFCPGTAPGPVLAANWPGLSSAAGVGVDEEWVNGAVFSGGQELGFGGPAPFEVPGSVETLRKEKALVDAFGLELGVKRLFTSGKLFFLALENDEALSRLSGAAARAVRRFGLSVDYWL